MPGRASVVDEYPGVSPCLSPSPSEGEGGEDTTKEIITYVLPCGLCPGPLFAVTPFVLAYSAQRRHLLYLTSFVHSINHYLGATQTLTYYLTSFVRFSYVPHLSLEAMQISNQFRSYCSTVKRRKVHFPRRGSVPHLLLILRICLFFHDSKPDALCVCTQRGVVSDCYQYVVSVSAQK